ncbi:hypothetical protein RXV94_04475 [Yeosuana sp. MJ-SS3]|uniref:Uncharacterized protein n=1 Tax=Gilvirhabdus luticola TaxID=3079858 RepID=A0ABU3U5L1_9FLAO|nr:hypothetical protein [Yeosuana sp. MJ-SS3]MDU8885405.1 hypothetical protein [Yeosuana sp. MJ-SS3]
MRAKIVKYSVLVCLVGFVICGIYYLNLSNRHKAIVKTQLLHKLSIIDNSWETNKTDTMISFTSPSLLVDGIYKSMEGPKAQGTFQIDSNKEDLVWLTSFETLPISSNEKDTLSTGFMCHSNIDFFGNDHLLKWNLNSRIGEQYPRLTTMSNGIEKYKLPEGFGVPIFTNENLILTTQTLNHNIKNEIINVKHRLNIGYKNQTNKLKPLMSKTVFIMLPYDSQNPFKGPTEKNPSFCLPVETKNHSYLTEKGESLSGHWVIFPGKATFSYDITNQLHLKDSTTMHYIVSHLHPFAEALSFRDKTLDSTLFTSVINNYNDKIGLQKVSDFSSRKGIMLYPNRKYELVLKTNNTTAIQQDMMASMFVFLYDKEIDEKIQVDKLIKD